MAIISSSSKPASSVNGNSYIDEHPIIDLDLKNRQFNGPDNYLVAITGDNHSQVLRFSTPRQYDGVDLFGTFCVLTYYTSWKDDSPIPKNSKGYIILNGEETEDEKLEYKWLLDLAQTAKAGACKFTLTFYLPLDEDFYYENNIELDEYTTIEKQGDTWVIVKHDEKGNITETKEYNYYTLSSNSGSFTIKDPGMGQGGPLYIAGDIALQLQKEINTKPGLKIEDGGEIFNDYENNKALTLFSHAEGVQTIAGTYAFNIIQAIAGDNTYILDSVEGLEIGDVISIKWFNSYINCAKISYIHQESNTVAVDKFITNSDTQSPRKLFVIAKPTIGTEPFDEAAHAEGINTQAVLAGSHAEGGNTKAMGRYAHAEGVRTEAIYAAHSEGQDSKALGEASHSEGGYTIANANFSHTEGYKTITSGEGASHAEGGETTASGRRSHAEGSLSEASGVASHSEGLNTRATGDYSHAEGYAEGAVADFGAKGKGSHSEGYNTLADGAYTHAEGNNTIAKGQATHAEGVQTQATAYGAHSEGNITKARNTAAHAEGSFTIADGIGSHSEGIRTRAVGAGSHAEGFVDDGGQDYYGATGKCAHTEGYNTIASGEAAHAEGYNTVASGMYSHAGGMSTKATEHAQTVIGWYNKEDADALFIVGNGTSYSASSRKNAFAVKKDGSAEIQMVSTSPNSVVNKEYVDSAIGDIETVLDSIIAIQDFFIGGATE